MHDLVIKGGTLVDGTGGPAREWDVAIDGDRISQVGSDVGPGRRELDAKGRLVAPGWVDVHTHYDGQVTWDPYLSPSGWHGVTTVVMGNCGVGFAPAAPERHDWLIGLMEGVEDIPGTALAEGIHWDWESFPEYLDAVEKMPRALDVGTQVPHGAVRAYVMGDRGASNEKATPTDIERMSELVYEGIRAGALGFSTSRTMLHRAVDGEPVPGTFASADELLGIGRALGRAGHGVFEMASDLNPVETEMEWMRTLSTETGLPVTFAIQQFDGHPTGYRHLLDLTEKAVADGANVLAQVACRPTGLLIGLQSSFHPFIAHPTYQAELARLDLDARVARMRTAEVRARLLSEETAIRNPMAAMMATSFHKLYPLGDPPDYEPAPERSIAAIAEREGKPPAEIAYDMLLQNGGRELLYFPLFGYSDGNFDALREMITHPNTVMSLSDGGAHCGVICDASFPTFLLAHWVRDRRRGERVPLEWAVQRQTRDTARVYGLHDRGVLARGMKADVNVIDFDGLRLRVPEMVHDLPAGGRRLVQRADGYEATLVSGQVVYEGGEPTGELPGRLVRGVQPAPVV